MCRARAFFVASLLAVATSSCIERGPTEGGRAVSLDIQPRFQIDPSLFEYDPIDQIRLTARSFETMLVVGEALFSVAPDDATWTLPLSIDLDGEDSLEVLVAVELLSGGVVQWSGVQGPFTVRPGVSNPSQSVAMYRGPLDNQEVESIQIEDAPPTLQLEVGASTTLSALVTLALGSGASPIIYWTSSDETVATVTAQGPTAMLTAVAVGMAEIVVSAGPEFDEIAVEVIPEPLFDVIWEGTTTDWSTGSNWSTRVVPQPSERVLIPSTGTDPVLSQNAAVGDLTVAPGATLTLGDAQLDVRGDLDAGNTIGGLGSVQLSGTGVDIQGTIQTPVNITGSASASGDLEAESLVIQGAGARLDVNGQRVTVVQNLLVQSGGVLEMTTPGDVVGVGGDAVFSGGDTNGLLIQGSFSVGGNFTAQGTPNSFSATGNHTVAFNGSQHQTVQFVQPGLGQQHFGHVVFDNASGVTVSTDMLVTQVLEVITGAVDAGDQTVSVTAGLIDPNGGLSYGQLSLIGNVAVLPSTILGPVFVESGVGWPVDGATIEGDLTVVASLSLGGFTLTVTGDVSSIGATQVGAGGLLSISGLLTLGSGSALQVDGTVTAANCLDNGATISGSGTQPCGGGGGTKSWVGGADPDPADWNDPNNWNPVGVPAPSDAVVIAGAAVSPQLPNDATIAALTIGAPNSLTINGDLTVNGDIDAGGSGVVSGYVIATGPGAVIQGSFDQLDLTGGTGQVLSGPTSTTGSLTLSNADLNIGSQTLTVAADLSILGTARLVMTLSGGVVSVGGSALFNGGDHSGLLTNGLLEVAGNFEATDASSGSFVGEGSHVLSFNGTSPQQVLFGVPGSSAQRVNNLQVQNTLGVTFNTDAHVAGSATLTGLMDVPASNAVDVAGNLLLQSGSTLNVEGTLTVGGTCTNNGGTLTGSGTLPSCSTGPGGTYTWIGGASGAASAWDESTNWNPVGVPGAADDVVIPQVSFLPILAADQSVASLAVTDFGYLNLGGFTLTVSGDVDVELANGVFNGEVVVTGPGVLLEGALPSLTVLADRTLTDQTLVQGDLTLTAELDVSGQNLTVAQTGQTDGDLLVNGPNARLVMTQAGGFVLVVGDALFNGADHDGFLTQGVLQVYGNFNATDASPTSFVSSGLHQVTFSGQADQLVSFDIPGPGQQRLNQVVISSFDRTTFVNDAYVTGDLDLVSGLVLVPFGSTVTVAGDMGLAAFTTLVVDGTGTVSVAGQCLVTQGALVFGQGTHPCGTPSAATRLWLGGAIGAEMDWASGANWFPSGVPQASEVVAIPQRPYAAQASTDLQLAGLIIRPGGAMDLLVNTLEIAGEVENDGWIFGGTVVLNSPSVTPVGVRGQFENLDVRGAGPRIVTGFLSTLGNLDLRTELVLGANTATVSGNLSVLDTGGLLTMTDPFGSIGVFGSATFDGAATTGSLTDGILQVGGDFTAGESNVDDTFNSTGTRVMLFGGTDQVVTFTQPGVGLQTFSDLQVYTDGAAILESDVYVTGVLEASSTTLRRGDANEQLFVEGFDALIQVFGVTFDGLRVNYATTNPAAVNQLVLSTPTWTNMGDDETQLYLQVPGDPGGGSIKITDPIFSEPLAAGFFLVGESAPGFGETLLIDVSNPTPALGANGEQYLEVGNTIITWGP